MGKPKNSDAKTITLRDQATQEERVQCLYDVKRDGSGRIAWEATKEAFGADLVEISSLGNPGLFPSGDKQGLTRQTFFPNQQVEVVVHKKAGRVL